jgi:formylglycine-generating enzyme required for sulfatase activity
MAGNVWRWTLDCWSDYYGGPLDGAPATNGDCSRRALRGGSWAGNPGNLRSADRLRNNTAARIFDIGFRVARVL